MLQKMMLKWIIVEDGDVFEGHQGHWSDCFFANATIGVIETYLQENKYKYVIRDMTPEEIEKYPAFKFQQFLIDTYGEV